jgi:hypothetical protein
MNWTALLPVVFIEMIAGGASHLLQPAGGSAMSVLVCLVGVLPGACHVASGIARRIVDVSATAIDDLSAV